MYGRLIANPWRALQDTPVSSGMVLLLAVYHFWLGTVLINVTSHLPIALQAGYAGPRSLISLEAWGWWHIVAGVIGLMRLFAHNDRRISLILHLISMSVILAWAVAFDLGPPTTGQVAYTFVAVVSFLSAFTVQVIERRYGMARPPLR